MLMFYVEKVLYFSRNKSANVTTHKTLQQDYLEAAQFFHWATELHFLMFFTGGTGKPLRNRRMLSRLSKKYAKKNKERSLYSAEYEKQTVYIVPRKKGKGDFLSKVNHGLGCTECMVRLWRSNMSGQIIEEKEFVGYGCIPDFGIQYPNGEMLLVEYATKDNYTGRKVIKNKLTAYRNYLWLIEQKFKATSVLLYVIDISKETLEKFVNKLIPLDIPVYFVDYQTFKNVEIGKQLSAPIYIQGETGEITSLNE